MDALLKSLLFGFVFLTTLIVAAVFFNEDQNVAKKIDEHSIEVGDDKKMIAYTYSDWADYPSDFLVG